MTISQGPPSAQNGSIRPPALPSEILDRLVDGLALAVVVSDADGFVVRTNPTARRLLGPKAGPLEGRAIAELFPSETQAEALRFHLQVVGSATMHRASWASLGVDEESFTVKDHTGQVFRVSTFRESVTIENGEISDATLRRMKEDLREKLETVERQGATIRLLSRVLNSAPIVLVGVDAEGAITLADGKGFDLIGIDPGDLMGDTLAGRLKDPALATAVERALAGDDLRTSFEGATGIYFDGWLTPLRRQKSGEVNGALLFAIDASERVTNETELRQQLVLIERQAQTIRSLATPIIKVAAGVLCLPVIGTVDSGRAAQIMETLLEGVMREQARFAIIDLTGVELIDTSSADHLLQIVRAASVLGVDSILCGLRPAVAQTVVALGVDLTTVKTMRSLEAALRHCQKRMQGHDDGVHATKR
jgi:rsbT co-antagonist protein RsbR